MRFTVLQHGLNTPTQPTPRRIPTRPTRTRHPRRGRPAHGRAPPRDRPASRGSGTPGGHERRLLPPPRTRPGTRRSIPGRSYGTHHADTGGVGDVRSTPCVGNGAAPPSAVPTTMPSCHLNTDDARATSRSRSVGRSDWLASRVSMSLIQLGRGSEGRPHPGIAARVGHRAARGQFRPAGDRPDQQRGQRHSDEHTEDDDHAGQGRPVGVVWHD